MLRFNFLEVHADRGTEAQDWASMRSRIFMGRWAEDHLTK